MFKVTLYYSLTCINRDIKLTEKNHQKRTVIITKCVTVKSVFDLWKVYDVGRTGDVELSHLVIAALHPPPISFISPVSDYRF